MEITLKIDGKEKVFRQEKTTFATMLKALEYQEALLSQIEMLEELSEKGIEDDIDYEKFETNPTEDVERSMNLIVAYFDGQFSYDEFVNGAYFDNAQELHRTAQEVMYEILTEKTKDTDIKKVKPQQKK